MKICHVITMGDINNMGSITRDMYYNCVGTHVYSDLYSHRFPNADIFILHCCCYCCYPPWPYPTFIKIW